MIKKVFIALLIAVTFSPVHAMFLFSTDTQVVKQCHGCFCDFNVDEVFDRANIFVCTNCQMNLSDIDTHVVGMGQDFLEYLKVLKNFVINNRGICTAFGLVFIGPYLQKDIMLSELGRYGFNLYILKKLAEQAMNDAKEEKEA